MSGCALVKIQPVSSHKMPPEHVLIKNYNLNEHKMAYVGETIITHKDYYISKSYSNILYANKSFTYGDNYSFEENHEFVIKGITEYNKQNYYLIDFDNREYMPCYRMIDRNGIISNRFVYFNQFGPEVHPMSVSLAINPLNTRFLRKQVEEIDKSSGFINFEIIYTGIDNNSLTLLYREFTPDNLIRAAYSQDLKYPNDSKTIRFRNIVIDVSQANSELISYSVKQDGL